MRTVEVQEVGIMEHNGSRGGTSFIVSVYGGDEGAEPLFQGTGIVVAPDRVLTCKHVVMEKDPRGNSTDELLQKVLVHVEGQEQTFRARVAVCSGEQDLAILELESHVAVGEICFLQGITPDLSLGLAACALYAVGYPADRAGQSLRRYRINDSLLSGSQGPSHLVQDMQISGGLPAGFSGSPILLEHKEQWICVGVVYLGGESASTSRVIMADAVLEFLKESGIHPLRSMNAQEIKPVGRRSGLQLAHKRNIRVYLSSPGDLVVERKAFKHQIELLNLGYADGEGAYLEPLLCEDELAFTGVPVQSVINKQIDSCDVFVLALYRYWGRPALDSGYSSYTEEEFYRAFHRFEATGAPAILVFFKNIDPETMADAGPHLERILKFRRWLEDTRKAHYRSFADESEFRAEMVRHIRAYISGELPGSEEALHKVDLPEQQVVQVEHAASQAKEVVEKAEEKGEEPGLLAAREAERSLTLARQAAQAAKEGRIEEARQAFAMATFGTTQLEVLNLAWLFYMQTNELERALTMIDRWLAIAEVHGETEETSLAYSNLGLLYFQKGDLGKSLEVLQKALTIQRKVGGPPLLAEIHRRLGATYSALRDLTHAESAFREALRIDVKNSLLTFIGMDFDNLSLVYRDLGVPHKSEETFRIAVELYEKAGALKDLAAVFRQLGQWHLTRGNFADAEHRYLKALDMEQRLNSQESLAATYTGLGTVYCTREEWWNRAEEAFHKALENYEASDCHEGIAASHLNLGILAFRRRNWSEAISSFETVRPMVEAWDMRGLVADTYHWLGSTYCMTGDLETSVRMYQHSLEINHKLGRQEQALANGTNISLIFDELCDTKEADAFFNNALARAEASGKLDEMAAHYDTAGKVAFTSKKLDLSERIFQKALTIRQKIGDLEGIAGQYESLGDVYLELSEHMQGVDKCGCLSKAKGVFEQALTINEKLGRKESTGTDFGKLASIHLRINDLDCAERLYGEALRIAEELGHLGTIAVGYFNLGTIQRMRNDLEGAKAKWTMARDLANQVGLKKLADEAQECISMLGGRQS